MHLLILTPVLFSILYSYQDHIYANDFISFLNQVLLLERHHLDTAHESENYRMRNQYSRLAILSIKSFQALLNVVMFMHPCTILFLPYAVWRIVPRLILDKFSNIEIGGVVGFILSELGRRVLSGWYSYILLYCALTRYRIVLILSIISSQSYLILMLIELKRSLRRCVCSNAKINSTVRSFREIQLLCSIYNDIHKRHVIPSLVITTMAGVIFPIFMFASKFTRIDFHCVLMFGAICIIDGIYLDPRCIPLFTAALRGM